MRSSKRWIEKKEKVKTLPRNRRRARKPSSSSSTNNRENEYWVNGQHQTGEKQILPVENSIFHFSRKISRKGKFLENFLTCGFSSMKISKENQNQASSRWRRLPAGFQAQLIRKEKESKNHKKWSKEGVEGGKQRLWKTEARWSNMR